MSNKDKNKVSGKVDLTRRLGHIQQVVKYLDPNKKKYNRKNGKAIPCD